MNPLAPVLAAMLPAAIVIAEHYAPWQRWLKRPLPRLAAYVIGVLAFLPAATVAALVAATTVVEALALVWLAVGSAGVTTFALWYTDWQNEKTHRMADELDRQIYGQHE